MSITANLRSALFLALAMAAPAAMAQSLPFEISPIANVQYEWAQVDSDRVADRSDEGFRRARLGLRLKDRDNRWQFVADHDLADRTPPDAYLELTPAAGHALRFGQFKQPFSLEDANSDKHTALLEPSMVGVFAISRRIGAEYARFGQAGTVNVAVFGQRLDGTRESLGATMRGTRVLFNDGGNVAHLGLSVASERPDEDTTSFSANPGTVFTTLRAASTGTIAGVDRIDRAALEGLWIHQAWTVQAELAQVAVRRDGADVSGDASSVLLTWSPSGDVRAYKRGVASAPSFDGSAAWELALRWSAIDLDDGAVRGGRADSLGIAATCYLHKNVRLIANVLQLDTRRRGVEDRPLVAGVRLQLTY